LLVFWVQCSLGSLLLDGFVLQPLKIALNNRKALVFSRTQRAIVRRRQVIY
jgi:hypothetical protein